MLTPVSISGHNPKAAVSRVAFQEIRFVGRTAKYTLARVLFRYRTVGGPVGIILTAYIGFHLLYVASFDTTQFGQLYYPTASRLLHTAFTLHRYQAVVKPLTAHHAKQGRFAYALGPGHNQAIVVLTTGIHNAGYGGGKVLSGHSPVKRGIFNA